MRSSVIFGKVRQAKIFLFIAIMVWSVTVHAKPRVVILASQKSVAHINRISSELLAVDLEPVVQIEKSNETSNKELNALARRSNARAGLILFFEAKRIELWQLQNSTGIQRESLIAKEDESWDQLATRTVEMLRAKLLPLPSVGVAPKRLTHTAPQAFSRFNFRLSGGPTFSPGGLTVLGHLWFIPSLDIRPWFRLELALVFPLSPSVINGQEGTANVYLGLSTAGVRFMLGQESWRLRPNLALGVGASFMHMRGEAVAPYSSETEQPQLGVTE